MERVKADLDEHGVVEQFPKMEGRQMVMVMAPKEEISYAGVKISRLLAVKGLARRRCSSMQSHNKWFRVFKCSCQKPPGVIK